eukprot:UN3646
MCPFRGPAMIVRKAFGCVVRMVVAIADEDLLRPGADMNGEGERWCLSEEQISVTSQMQHASESRTASITPRSPASSLRSEIADAQLRR